MVSADFADDYDNGQFGNLEPEWLQFAAPFFNVSNPCICQDVWEVENGDGSCGQTQNGCPATACDGDSRSWCILTNPGCDEQEDDYTLYNYDEADEIGWAYCDNCARPAQSPVADGTYCKPAPHPAPAPAACCLDCLAFARIAECVCMHAGPPRETHLFEGQLLFHESGRVTGRLVGNTAMNITYMYGAIKFRNMITEVLVDYNFADSAADRVKLIEEEEAAANAAAGVAGAAGGSVSRKYKPPAKKPSKKGRRLDGGNSDSAWGLSVSPTGGWGNLVLSGEMDAATSQGHNMHSKVIGGMWRGAFAEDGQDLVLKLRHDGGWCMMGDVSPAGIEPREC